MNRLRYVMLGGFLGAGKTTAVARLARHYSQQGRKVGIVTNDQAENLVDTSSLRSQGHAVEEIAGACFCCRFDDLMQSVERLETRERPDVLLAEPVGSCTDLVATVLQPLRDLYGQRFDLAPYVVLFKPSHGLRILKQESGAGFSPKAAYVFRKQLEEADAIAINRIDELAKEQIDELRGLINDQFPGVPVLAVSAKTGEAFDGLTEFLDQQGEFGKRILDIDYDTYAEGEAELGWLNASAQLSAAEPFELDELLLDVITRLRVPFSVGGMEVAHLKVIGLADLAFGVANLVSNASEPELSLPSRCRVNTVELVVNARVAADPAHIDEQVRSKVHESASQFGADVDFRTMQSFRPGRPVPTHRYARP